MVHGSVPAMSEADAFAHVLQEPELDAPRLAFADVVGGDRAAAIHHGIWARDARRKRLDDTAFRHEAKQRVLFRQHPEWTTTVLERADGVHVGRGLVEGVTISLEAWIGRGREIVELAPILHLKLTNTRGRLGKLAADPMLAHIRSLDLESGDLQDDDVRALVASSHLARLRWLSLARNDIGTEGQAALAAATRHLPALRHVNLALNAAPDPTDEGAIDETGNVRWQARAEGLALEEHHGPLPWLHANYLDADRQIFYAT